SPNTSCLKGTAATADLVLTSEVTNKFSIAADAAGLFKAAKPAWFDCRLHTSCNTTPVDPKAVLLGPGFIWAYTPTGIINAVSKRERFITHCYSIFYKNKTCEL